MAEAGRGASGVVLVVDDDESARVLLARWLEREGYEVEQFASGEQCLDALARMLPEAVCLDLHMPGLGGLSTLTSIREHLPRLPVVILTADADVERVVEAMRAGAYDYLVKPVDRTQLLTTIRNAVERYRMALRLSQLEREVAGPGYSGLLGRSPAMREMFRQIDRVASTEVSVLIHGESGSGKELVARALHDNSARAAAPFVALNCAAIPDTLQESELFGHERGSFTGATAQRRGCFEEANRGTLFLDEVAELALPLQAKLLRVLQEKVFRRVGGERDLRSDFRLVTATHRDLAAEVAAGRFREDLYFRVAVFDIEVPPLRDRLDDVALLAEEFLAEFASGGAALRLDPSALGILLSLPWPGNVRELRNALQRAAVVADGGVIRPADLPPRLLATAGVELAAPSAPLPPSVTGALPAPPIDGAAGPAPILPPADEPISLEELERRAILAAWERTDGNRLEMARQLGIGRTTLYRKLKEMGLG